MDRCVHGASADAQRASVGGQLQCTRERSWDLTLCLLLCACSGKSMSRDTPGCWAATTSRLGKGSSSPQGKMLSQMPRELQLHLCAALNGALTVCWPRSTLPIMYPKFTGMAQPGDTIYIARYLVSGAESSSVYLKVRLCLSASSSFGMCSEARVARAQPAS